ncbi:outer membrane protein assembly factor BamA [Occallatibacter riparius]|uniref:Outer membrane protein assembly factor BamA n=1 Tax=Occallatibacter riparius TaxID=1002689 RepID=A0A9J7BUD7_9BACT|nr:outer membrane protein assembly factor BamA [Occallatibacter riparius]UWZ85354.1 outer membrane protein assembly factor BamA [Occallatibacter riparius]
MNHRPHQYDVRSPKGFPTVKMRHILSGRALRIANKAACALLLFAFIFSSVAVLAQGSQTIEQIRVIGNRRIPKETVLARLFTHVGDQYDPISVERDFNSLWNTGYFENLRIEREDSEKGIILNVYVTEKPTIREVNYKGLNSFSVSDALDRFKKEKVAISVESQYDPTKVKRAEAVLRQMLAEHGHQFATIKTDVKTIPPASVQINFNIKEGPTVKVGNIRFTGNEHISSLQLRRSMKNLKPIGIPYSLFLENLFPKTFDSSKLEEDSERVRQAYRDKGYANAAVEEPQTQIRDQGGLNWLTFRPNKGKRIDILMPIEEGARYKLGSITFSGYKAFNNVRAMRAQFPLKDGDVFSATAMGKGLENLKKAYGQLGYINFGAIPTPHYDEQKKTVSFTVDIDEGKQFYVSRIEFQGNTITRDRVIRRELLLEEGQVYNSQAWEYSLLRLNQLEYFEPLKVEQDSEAHQDPDAGTVDLLLKVKEKGKNSIGLNGGVSGLSGAFLGVNYQTNNFLGLGETLSVQGNLGNVSRQFLFGFSQPYVHNRPLNLGFQIFSQKQDYNAAKNYEATTGQAANLSSAQQSLVQNYNQSSTGLNFSINYPLKKHSFQRLGLTYSLTKSDITAFSTASQTFFQTISFRSGIVGSNALTNIVNSSASFSYMYNTVNNPVRPRSGREITGVFQFSGIGGNLRYFSPLVAYKSFTSMHYLTPRADGRNVFGIRAQLGYIQGFGGDVAPPNNRFYSGGEADLRGFDIRGATPYGYVPNRATVQLTNPDGTCVPRDPNNPQLNQCILVPIPVYGIASIGGDTNFVTNMEYRIPIAGPVTFAFFDDFGITAALNKGQLKQSPEGFASLTAPLYGCPVYNNGSCQGGIPGSLVGFQRNVHPVAGTNFVPRMSVGGEISVLMPIINAPFRLYFAYNPLRLYERPYCNADLSNSSKNQSCSAQLITRDLFPPGGAGDFTWQQAQQGYGAQNLFREPRKTFRLTVSTTF